MVGLARPGVSMMKLMVSPVPVSGISKSPCSVVSLRQVLLLLLLPGVFLQILLSSPSPFHGNPTTRFLEVQLQLEVDTLQQS